VKGASAVVNWAFETSGPNTMVRQGSSRQSLRVGDELTVVGYRARDSLPMASAREIVMSDGRKVLVGTPVDGGPQKVNVGTALPSAIATDSGHQRPIPCHLDSWRRDLFGDVAASGQAIPAERPRNGERAWISTVDHKQIGSLYLAPRSRDGG
jgi:hypothetical protein